MRTASDTTIAPAGTFVITTPLAPWPQTLRITVTDEAGNPLSLERYRGQVVVMTFLYTTCEDTCPLTTQQIPNQRRIPGMSHHSHNNCNCNSHCNGNGRCAGPQATATVAARATAAAMRE